MFFLRSAAWLGGWQRRERRKRQRAGDRVKHGALADCTALSRTTVDALDDEAIAEQLTSSARKLVALGGVSSEIALLHTALSLRRMHYEVHLLVDCCGSLGKRSEQAAWHQMEAAGVVLSSVPSFLSA